MYIERLICQCRVMHCSRLSSVILTVSLKWIGASSTLGIGAERNAVYAFKMIVLLIRFFSSRIDKNGISRAMGITRTTFLLKTAIHFILNLFKLAIHAGPRHYLASCKLSLVSRHRYVTNGNQYFAGDQCEQLSNTAHHNIRPLLLIVRHSITYFSLSHRKVFRIITLHHFLAKI